MAGQFQDGCRDVNRACGVAARLGVCGGTCYPDSPAPRLLVIN